MTATAAIAVRETLTAVVAVRPRFTSKRPHGRHCARDSA
jgi:hypothetical protein